MKPFGLTGNIGCGKSTVASLLSTYPDVLAIDCDRIAKEAISSGRYNDAINSVLGIDAFPKGSVDFKAIAKIIFEDLEKKGRLEALIHPIVWSTVDQMVASTGISKICVVESALIFETRSEHKFAAIITATCGVREQFRRLREHRRMTDGLIRMRLARQLPSSEKGRRAKFTIDTDCSLDQLKGRVHALYLNLKRQKGALS